MLKKTPNDKRRKSIHYNWKGMVSKKPSWFAIRTRLAADTWLGSPFASQPSGDLTSPHNPIRWTIVTYSITH